MQPFSVLCGSFGLPALIFKMRFPLIDELTFTSRALRKHVRIPTAIPVTLRIFVFHLLSVAPEPCLDPSSSPRISVIDESAEPEGCRPEHDDNLAR